MYTVISWIIAGVLYVIFNTLAWRGATFYEMYLPGHDLFTTLLQPLAPFNHYDQWISLLVGVIAGFSIVGLIRPYDARKQPVKGLLNIITGIIIGVVLWLVLTPIIGSPHVFSYHMATVGPIEMHVPLTVPIRAPANVTALLLCIVLAILVIQHPFQMHWFAAKGLIGKILALVVAVIIGVIVFFVVLGMPSAATALSWAGVAAGASGLQALAYYAWIQYANLALSPASAGLRSSIALVTGWPSDMVVSVLLMTGMSTFLEVQAAMQHLATSCVLGWFVLGGIMWLLIYESFTHWPWK